MFGGVDLAVQDKGGEVLAQGRQHVDGVVSFLPTTVGLLDDHPEARLLAGAVVELVDHMDRTVQHQLVVFLAGLLDGVALLIDVFFGLGCSGLPDRAIGRLRVSGRQLALGGFPGHRVRLGYHLLEVGQRRGRLDLALVRAADAATGTQVLEGVACRRAAALPRLQLGHVGVEVEVRVLAGDLDHRFLDVGGVLGQPQRHAPQRLLDKVACYVLDASRRHQSMDLRALVGDLVEVHVVGLRDRRGDAGRPLGAARDLRLGDLHLIHPVPQDTDQRLGVVVVAVDDCVDGLPRILLLVVGADRAQHHGRVVDLGRVDLHAVVLERQPQRLGDPHPVVALDGHGHRPVAVQSVAGGDHHGRRHADRLQGSVERLPALLLRGVWLLLPDVEVERQGLEPRREVAGAAHLGFTIFDLHCIGERTNAEIHRCVWFSIQLQRASSRSSYGFVRGIIEENSTRAQPANDNLVKVGKNASEKVCSVQHMPLDKKPRLGPGCLRQGF